MEKNCKGLIINYNDKNLIINCTTPVNIKQIRCFNCSEIKFLIDRTNRIFNK